MAGIYIHIPFCRHACNYCNFHFSVARRYRKVYTEALRKEIALQKHFFDDALSETSPLSIDTVYIGGGTPSVLHINELTAIFSELRKRFPLDGVQEVTLEANPDDLTSEITAALRTTPVNRLSIGVQSVNLRDLQFLSRQHSPEQALESIRNSRKAGFENINADLIYGIPGSDDLVWEESVRRVIETGVEHLSAYALTVEKNTGLDYLIRKGKVPPVSDEQAARQFGILCDITEQYGFVQYEVSNFSLPGKVSRHNLSYWTGAPYLGLGPSAHSYKPGQRFWNIANTQQYIASLCQGVIPVEGERLSPVQMMNEYVMTSLRTRWGCDLVKVEAQWGAKRRSLLQKKAVRHISNGCMTRDRDRLVLTRKGMFFADGIAADLFA